MSDNPLAKLKGLKGVDIKNLSCCPHFLKRWGYLRNSRVGFIRPGILLPGPLLIWSPCIDAVTITDDHSVMEYRLLPGDYGSLS